MADDKSNRGNGDRGRVAGGETYEVEYFATKHGLSRDEAQALIDRVGNDRDALEAAVADRGGNDMQAKPRARRTTSKTNGEPRKRRSTKSDDSVLAAPVEAVNEAIVEPVRKAVQPAKRKAIAAIDSVADTTTKNVQAATRSAARAPAAARRRVGEATDSVKKAVPKRTGSMLGVAAAGIVTGLALNLGRKMAVQAPSAFAGDWFDAVKLEHKLALALFDKLQATSDQEVTKRGALLTQLKHALGKHAFTEENVLYPALRAWGDKADADKLNHDHGYVKQYLYDLERMEKSSSGFLLMVADFRAQIEEHIEEEEAAIFPPFHAAMSEAENARVTAMANKEGFKLA
jgi:hemerythrin superfamily protein